MVFVSGALGSLDVQTDDTSTLLSGPERMAREGLRPIRCGLYVSQ